MDILTHLLSGAVAGLLYTPKKNNPHSFQSEVSVPDRGTPATLTQEESVLLENRKAVRWTLLIGSVLPDIDILFLLGGWSMYRTYHRGPTHSILGVLVLAFLLSWVVGKRYPRGIKSRLFIGSLIGMGMHLILDLLTSYRTYLLWPFSDYRFSTGILRFHDRTGWWVLGTALLVGWLVGKWGNLEKAGNNLRNPTLIGGMGLLVYAGYILMRAGQF